MRRSPPSVSRRLTVAARLGVSSAWAACLIIVGLWLIDEGGQWLSLPREFRIASGLAAMAGGIFVFMVMVGDRLVPGVGRRQSMWKLEMGVFGMMIVIALTGVLLFSRGVLA